MTKKERRKLEKKADKIIKEAELNPSLVNWTMSEYRQFWDGKRIALCEILNYPICDRFLIWEFPWE